jgi:very-short-patch-repair endonuclease
MARARIRSTASAAPKATAKPKAAPKLTNEQILLIEQLRGKGYAALPEVRFHPERKWRIDVAVTRQWVDSTSEAIAIEINGGAWSRGRHTRGAGYIRDLEKLNALTELGWRVLQFTPQQVRTGEALAQIERCL